MLEPALRLGSPLPHLDQDWARPSHICTGTRLAPATLIPTALSLATRACCTLLIWPPTMAAGKAKGMAKNNWNSATHHCASEASAR